MFITHTTYYTCIFFPSWIKCSLLFITHNTPYLYIHEGNILSPFQGYVHFLPNMNNKYWSGDLKIDAACTLLLLLSFRKPPSSTQKHIIHTANADWTEQQWHHQHAPHTLCSTCIGWILKLNYVYLIWCNTVLLRFLCIL